MKRTKNGIRQFDDTSIESFRIIECLKKTGMPLKDIHQFQERCLEGDGTLKARVEMFPERREAVENQIAELQSVLDLINF